MGARPEGGVVKTQIKNKRKDREIHLTDIVIIDFLKKLDSIMKNTSVSNYSPILKNGIDIKLYGNPNTSISISAKIIPVGWNIQRSYIFLNLVKDKYLPWRIVSGEFHNIDVFIPSFGIDSGYNHFKFNCDYKHGSFSETGNYKYFLIKDPAVKSDDIGYHMKLLGPNRFFATVEFNTISKMLPQ
jgi:hypothetical protein